MTIANTTIVARVAAAVAGLALVASSFAFAVPAKAATVAEMEAQIAALLKQLQALQGGSSTSCAAFTMDMTIGASGAEVTRLQNWLISKGHTIAAGATGYFGAQTQAAVASYQRANGISPAAGYFGPMTRAKVNASCTTTTPTDPGDDDDDDNDDGDLEGGAGSIESTELVSGLNNEDVGEDEEDVEVAGLEIEVDDGSDIELTAVRLNFDQTDDNSGAASDDLEDVVSEISIWLDGEEVARVDADEFNDDNDFEKTISLDGGAIIRAGETGELTVAVSGVSNIDSSDVDSGWSVDFETVRFRDADGATITEDISENAVSFNLTTFADAAGTEITLSLTDSEDADDINDAHIIDIDDSDETEGVEVLAFTIEVEGDSDVTLDELPVVATSTGATVSQLATEARLMLDGEEVGSESLSGAGATTTITFDDLDLTLDADSENDFTIELDFNAEEDTGVDNGDTIVVSVSEANLEAGDLEDESGEDVSNTDISGSAMGEAHSVYDAGIMVEFVSADADETFTADDTGEQDQGTFRITFDVTAFDGDFRIDRSCEEGGSDAAGQGIEYTITNSASNTTTCDVSSSTTDSEDTANTFEVDEDRARRITLTVVATSGASTSAFAEVALESINWGTATDNTNANYYTFNLDDFKTDSLSLRGI